MFKDKLVKIIRKLVLPSPLDSIRRMPSKFSIHPNAVILESTSFRFDVPGHIATPCVTIGQDSMIGCNFIFESTGGEIKIGERTYIGGGTSLISRTGIIVGDDVWIAWGCYLYDHDSHSLSWRNRRDDLYRQLEDYKKSGNVVLNKDWMSVETAEIVIGNKVWIGFDSVILKGVRIGEGAIVGARSVVARDVPPYTIIAGNPARIIGEIPPDER